MILSCNKISKEFVTGPVLREVSFLINEKEKVAITGINGAGKSTLLKIIIGSMKADSGDVFFAKGTNIGYLAQHQEINMDTSVFDIMLQTKKDILDLHEKMRALEEKMKGADEDSLSSVYEEYSRITHQFEQRNGYAYKSEITGILKGLGFPEEDFHRKASTLSGGQKTRVHLGRILLEKPEILLLDEPTNHLDINSVIWLENHLKNYDGAILIVSHDRYFLDRIVSKIIELDAGIGTVFTGNYSAYSEKKKVLREHQLKAYLNQQKQIEHEEAVIQKLKSFNREKSIKRAESRMKLLNKIDRIEKPFEMNSEMKLKLKPFLTSGNDVLFVKDLKKSFGDHLLFSDINFTIRRGERVAITGGNGTGKTTLLKIIYQLIEADSGSVKLGTNVEIGYYDQEHQVLDPENTLFEEILDSYPELTNTEVRNLLASFLFQGDDVFKKVKSLSGGEKGRLSLCKLMLSEANFLLLDEPTNHLDMVSKEILEDVLCDYTGTILFVSHDRYFINKTATRILDLTEKQLLNYIGNYDYYLEKKETIEKSFLKEKKEGIGKPEETDSENKDNWKKQKEEQAKQRKIRNELKKIEEKIETLEKNNLELEEELANPSIASEVGKLMEIHKKRAANENELEKLMELWEEISSQTSI